MENEKTDLKQYTKLYSFEAFDIYKSQFNESHHLYLFHSGIDESSKIYQKEYAMIGQLKDTFPVITIQKKISTEDRYGYLFVSDHFEVIIQPIRDKNDILNYAKTLAELHVKLHTIKEDLEIESTHEKIEGLISNITTLDAYKEKLLELYKGINKKSCFCHYDFGPYHVLMNDSDVMVINWINAGYGNPMGDVAKTVFWLCSDYVPGFGPYMVGTAAKRDFVETYMHRYS